MKRHTKISAALPVLAAFLIFGSPAHAVTDWGANININLGPPPAVYDPPPELVWIPGDVYYIPETYLPERNVDIFFHNGYWWSPRGSRWYRANTPEGPWIVVETHVVPAPLYRVPRDYRTVYVRERRHVPYVEFREKHGDRGWKGKEMRDKRWKDRDRDDDDRDRGRRDD